VTGRLIPLLDPEFQDNFRQFRYTAYRLETLQVYGGSSEDDALAAFTAGREMPQDPDWDAWFALIRTNTEAGRIKSGVRVVTEPLTPYTQFQLAWGYGLAQSVGEQVQILPVGQGEPWPAELPEREDYWLFDSRDLYAMHYKPDGDFLGAESVTDPDRIVRACHLRDVAQHLAIPWADYMATQPELAKRVPLPLGGS